MNLFTNKEVTTTIDADGNEKTTTKETTSKITRNDEPDYIKLYTKMWCDFNDVPERWRTLFLQIIMRMSYCNSSDLEHSQIVTIYGMVTDDICKSCGWTDKSNVRRGLKVLCDCNALKKVGRATYQVNPDYAGRGEWKYNPKLQRGGVEDLRATFDFKTKRVSTEIVWADDGSNSELNELFRDGMGVTKEDETVLKTTESIPGQMSIDDYVEVHNEK